jgi:hypothetical protein
MKFYIPLKDIILGPGKRFDPSVNSEAEVVGFIKKAYGIISSTIRFPIERRKVTYYDPISI